MKPSEYSRLGSRIKPRSASALLNELMSIVNHRSEAQRDLAKRVGLTSQSLTNWKGGVHTPSIIDFEIVANAVGYELKLVKKQNDLDN